MKDVDAESSEHGRIFFERSSLRARICQIPVLLPGLFAVAIIAWLSIWLTEYVDTSLMGFAKPPISAVMVAILIGMLVSNAVSLPDWLRPGVQFAVKKILRLGIILLGIRLSISDFVQLGTLGVPIVVFGYAPGKWTTIGDELRRRDQDCCFGIEVSERMPCCSARATAWAREWAPSRARISLTYHDTVLADRQS
jgi:hypothetical protein